MSDEFLLPRATVRDVGGADGDIEVRLERDPRVIDVPSPGVGLTADGTLARLGETAESGFWLQHLPKVTRYRAAQVGELTAKILPDLSARMLVDVRSRQLPRVVRDLEPRIVLDLQHLGDRLTVLPTLVYGAPPCVRIDDDRMVYLQGPVPVRDRDAERRELHRLRAELDLLPGHRVTFEGRDLGAFASKLRRWRGALTGAAADLVGSQLRLVPRLGLTGADGAAAGPPELRFDLRFEVTGDDGGRAFRRRGRGHPRLAGAAGLRAAGRGRLGAAAARLAGPPRPARGRPAGGARDRRARGQPRPARARRCCAPTLEQPPPPGAGATAAAGRGLRAAAGGGAARRSRGDAAPVPAARAWTGSASSAAPAWAACWPTTWAWARRCRRWRCCARASSTLVVCPTSVLPNWQNELARFRPALKVTTYHGPGRQLSPDADVVLTTYAILRLDAERLQAGPGPGKPRWNLVILDEAQAIKNPDSQVARAAYALRRRRPAVPDRHADREPPGRAVEPAPLQQPRPAGRPAQLRRSLRPPHRRRASPGSAEQLRRKIRPFVLRRQKQEVAPELPPAHRGGAAHRARRARARDLRRRPGGDARRGGGAAAAGGRRDEGAGGAAAAAPGGLPPGAAARGSAGRRAPAARRSWSGWPRRWSWPPPRGTRRWCSRSGRRCWT